MSNQPKRPDLVVNPLESFALLTPTTSTAIDWLADHLTGEVLIFRGAIVVEYRCLAPLLDGARNDGLTCEGEAGR